MQSAPLPENEAARLNALRQYEILDTAPEQPMTILSRWRPRSAGLQLR